MYFIEVIHRTGKKIIFTSNTLLKNCEDIFWPYGKEVILCSQTLNIQELQKM